IQTLITSFPNADSSTTDGYGNLYELRLKTSNPTASTTYDVADIQITGSTWSVVYPAPSLTSTTTTLTATDATQVGNYAGDTVTLAATVSGSAPGTVQFESGTGTPTPIGT